MRRRDRKPVAPASVEESLPKERQLLQGASYPALLAAHAERLATFAEAGPLRCVPAGAAFDGEGFFALKLTWTHESGGSFVQTLRIHTHPRAMLQPLFDAINGQLRSARRPYLLYRCASNDGGEHAILATHREAATLRKARKLIEGPLGRMALARLGKAGFALPYASGPWKGFVRRDLGASPLGRCLVRARVLSRPRPLSFTLSRSASGVSVHWRLGKASAKHTYPADAPQVLPVLTEICRDLNRFLGSRKVSERFVIMTGESTWHEPRLLLLDPEWVDLANEAPDLLRGCLPSDDAAAHGRIPAAVHPPRLPRAPLARLPRVREIVERRRVLESDFKCSARPTDFPLLVKEIAAFAKLRVACEPTAFLTSRYRVHVTFEGKASVVELRDEKYPDVRPILNYLNSRLASRGQSRRLYRFTAGGFESGVLLASTEEAQALRDAAYLEEGTASEAALSHAIAHGDIERAVSMLRDAEFREYDDTLLGLGRLARTRANVARVLAALGPKAELNDLGMFVLAAWAEAGLPHAENLPPVPLLDAARGPTLRRREAERLFSVWRETLLRSPGAAGSLVDLQWAYLHAKSWVATRRIFDFILDRKDLHLSVYCNALYAAEKDNTGIEVDPTFDRRILARCLPFAEQNPDIYNNAACVYAELGEGKNVLAMLEKALAHGLQKLVAEKHALPQFSAYRDDLRFSDLWLRAGVTR